MLDPSNISALLFDLDGTLLDSDDQAVEKLARRIGRLGLRDPHQAARRLVMALETPGNRLMTLLDVLRLDAPLTGLTDRLRRWRGLRTPANFRLVEGADKALLDLSGHYRLAVVTTRGRRDAEAFLACFGLSDLFETVATRESTRRLKPHPAPVLHAAAQLSLPPERCAMVGDTTVDVRSARRAGAWAVAVLCGFGRREELERAGAHLILSSPAELPAALAIPPGRGIGRLRMAPLDPGAFLRAVVEAHRDIARERKVTLALDRPPALPLVLADRDRLAQAMGNLLGDALRRAPEGGHVAVRATDGGREVTVAIVSGGDPDITVARRVVEAHGGRIWAEPAPGGGRAVAFTIRTAALAL